MTIGTQIDLMISSIDSMASTTLYALVVGATIFVSIGLLGSAKEGEITVNEAVASSHAQASKRTSQLGVPEPRWQIFRYMNFLILVLFIGSIVEFYWNDSLWVFLLGWSVFLCYFFGFFGISFVHDITAHSEPELSPASRVTNSAGSHSAINKSKNISITHVSKVYDKGCGNESLSCKPSMSERDRSDALSDQDYIHLLSSNKIKDHELERRLGDCSRAVAIRRQSLVRRLDLPGLNELPHLGFDYQQVYGTNCEIVVGYMPIPVGLAGPIIVNGVHHYVPMATTEGCLVASTNRGCKAISSGIGVTAVVTQDAITRAPCVRMRSAAQAALLKIWCQDSAHFETLRIAFEGTTNFGKLVDLQVTVAGKNVYLRLSCFSGDAMGMNMVSKGSLAVIECLKQEFPDLVLVALSGNMCTDKKAASTNWIYGRGKSVVVEATVPNSIVQSVLKTSVQALIETNLNKNLIGSAMAGTIGGFNAHASNIVTAVFIATGQDPAQNVESSNCITLMENDDNGDLWISCTMPSLEVGTVGGGTSLKAQASCLKILGCNGGSKHIPGENAQKLATIVAATVMAGELSLLAALASNTLVQAHMQHNRKK